jgi:hypothetical protein
MTKTVKFKRFMNANPGKKDYSDTPGGKKESINNYHSFRKKEEIGLFYKNRRWWMTETKFGGQNTTTQNFRFNSN